MLSRWYVKGLLISSHLFDSTARSNSLHFINLYPCYVAFLLNQTNIYVYKLYKYVQQLRCMYQQVHVSIKLMHLHTYDLVVLLYAVIIVCVPFQLGLGQYVEFDCIGF